MERVARSGASAVITYEDLAEQIEVQSFAPNGQAFTDLLCAISRQTLKEQRGLISAVVVRKDRGFPGDGFFEFLHHLGRIEPNVNDLDDDAKRVTWTGERDLVDKALFIT